MASEVHKTSGFSLRYYASNVTNTHIKNLELRSSGLLRGDLW